MRSMKFALLAALLGIVFLWASTAGAGCPIVTKGRVQYIPCDIVYTGTVTMSGSVVIPGGVTDPTATKKTTAALNLFVRTTGNDSNTCLASGTACLTVAGAISKIPTIIEHAVSVDIGAGTFAGFNLTGRYVGAGSISVLGTMATSTPATGTATGTATAGTATTLTDAGQSWTASDLVGRYVTTTAGTFLIQSNTTTSLTIIGANSTSLNGLAYTIQQPSSIISSSIGVYGVSGNGLVTLSALAPSAGAYVIVAQSGYVQLSYMPFTSPGDIGVTVVDSNVSLLTGVYVSAAAVNGFYLGNLQSLYANGVMSNGGGASGGGSGIELLNVKGIQDMYAVSNGDGDANGILLNNSSGFATAIYASTNTTNGLKLIGNSHLGIYGTGVTTLSGTSNTERGVAIDSYSELFFKGTPTITGTLGNVTLDRGATTLTWATHFNDNGDMAVNGNLFCRAERKD